MASTARQARPQLELAGVGDVPHLRQVLAAAFYDDPVLSWLVPPDASGRRRRLSIFFELELHHFALRYGSVWATADRTGAALCLPPGAWHMPTNVVARHGRAFARVFGRRLPAATALLVQMERRHFREPHYYFAYIGVEPGQQGKGLGTKLMEPTLERCDREGLPGYLEASSERNARLYERLGFEVREELRVGGSPPLRLMVRPPRGTS